MARRGSLQSGDPFGGRCTTHLGPDRANGNESTPLPAFDVSDGRPDWIYCKPRVLDGTYDPARPLIAVHVVDGDRAELSPYQDQRAGPERCRTSPRAAAARQIPAKRPPRDPAPPNLGAIQFTAMNLARSAPIPVHLVGKVSGSPNSRRRKSGTTGGHSRKFERVVRVNRPEAGRSRLQPPRSRRLPKGRSPSALLPSPDSTFSVVPRRLRQPWPDNRW